MGVFNKEWEYNTDAVLTWCEIRPLDYKTGRVFHTNKALWDTGATTTVISSRIVQQLHLQPFDSTGVSGIMGVSNTNTYLVHISLPTGDTYTFIEVMESDFDDYDIIIGMDIISLGDFCFTNANSRSCFSFRFPAKEHIVLG